MYVVTHYGMVAPDSLHVGNGGIKTTAGSVSATVLYFRWFNYHSVNPSRIRLPRSSAVRFREIQTRVGFKSRQRCRVSQTMRYIAAAPYEGT